MRVPLEVIKYWENPYHFASRCSAQTRFGVTRPTIRKSGDEIRRPESPGGESTP